MPEQISRRSSIKIYESPLHRGSQHGSPAFRKKKLLKSNSRASDGQMSDLEISPPPRTKRSSLPRKIEDDAKDSHVVKRPTPLTTKKQKVTPLPPKPPNVITTSRIGHYKTIGNNSNLSNRLPPPHTNTPNIIAVRKNQTKDDQDHIYESLDIRSHQRPPPPPPLPKDWRLSSEVQCWPWLRQASLPPSQRQNTTTTSNLAKTIQTGLRSVSLGRGVDPPSGGSNRGRTLLQRLAGLRRSFNSREKVHQDIQGATASASAGTTPRRADDPDWVFFRGFGAKRREDVEPYAVNHGPLLTIANCVETPKAPPRRKRPQRMLLDKEMQPLRRSLSFTDAHFIAQAVYEGDTKLIEDLYPDFPRSEPIYAVVDKSKKRNSKCFENVSSEKSQQSPPLPPLILPACPEAENERSSRSRSNSVRSSSNTSPTQQPASAQIQRTSTVGPAPAGTNLQIPPASQDVNDVVGENRANLLADEEVTVASSSVMFVRQSENIQSKNTPLPDVVNDSSDVNDHQQQWNNSGSNSVVIECSSSTNNSKANNGNTWQSNVHPFAHRTQHRYASKVVNNVKKSKENLLPQGQPITSPTSVVVINNEEESLEDSFEKIIRSADHSLHQAESILSSLRQRSKTLPAHATPPCSSSKSCQDDSGDSLGSDIEANIRKLEKTQAKINAALEAFRSMKEEPAADNSLTMTSVVASHSRPLTVKATSRTAPAKMRQNSFCHNKSSDSSGTSLRYYEADVEESNSGKDGSWSDSESGFLHPPIKSKLKGLLGTWGRNARRQMRNNHRPLAPSISDPVPILQPPTATVSEYARRIEILAHDLANGSMSESSRQKEEPSSSSQQNRGSRSPGGSSSGYYTPPSAGVGDVKQNGSKKSSSPSADSSQRNSVSSESEDPSDSEDQISAPSLTSSSTVATNNDGGEQNKTKAFYIANELMTSERVFVDVLRLLNVDFREYLQKARRESKSGLMPDADYSRLFNNLPELQTLNEDLLQDFESRIANWSSLSKIADVIVKKGPFLKLYTTYIREFSAMNYHFDDCCQKFPKFAKLVKDFEKRDSCRNLKLQHFMLKPVQRLPQYKLLLEDYLRHLPHDSIDFDDCTIALRIVSEAAEHANNTIRQGDKFRRMLQLQSRLGDYFELIRPGRDLIKEGELQKVSRKGVGPRYFILLSDCLLYTAYRGSWSGSDTTSLRVSYQIPLSTLDVKLPPNNFQTDTEMATELHLTSPVRSFCVRAATVRERNAWLDALNTAIEDHNSRKATFIHHDQRTECKVGTAPPIWVPDRRVSMCQKCTVEFTVLLRRHHCRGCGQVVCSTCSGNKAPLRYLEFDSGRVCDHCFDTLEKELGNVESLRHKFKKRDLPSVRSSSNRYNVQQQQQRLLRPSSANANNENLHMSGYLRKKQKNGAKWKRLWFVLKDRVLYAYKAPEDALPCDTFSILGFKLETLSEKNIELYEGESGGLVFQLAHPGSETLIFCADNDNICEKWMAAINEAVDTSS